MKKTNKIKAWILPAAVMFIVACAQQGAPTGGEKDEDPPKLVRSVPANYSSNFKDEKILITFDEYLDMGNFTQELVVSPPMEEKPLVMLRNKTLIIEFEEELKEDVTYTFNFGEGISDLNEKNVLLNFEYVFSTGDFLDSLSIKGTLKNAFDLSIPESPIYIMLYNELNDSLPLLEIPYYVGRTDKEGNFAVNNLRAGVYKMFVLKDGNNNFLYDLPTEQVAFLDTSIFVDGEYFRRMLLESGTYDSSDLFPDTLALPVDTVGMSQDSVLILLDSLERIKPDFNSLFVDLFMFEEAPVNQYISDYSREDRNALFMMFNLPLTDSFSFEPIFPPDLSFESFIPEFGKERDSLTIWMSDTVSASFDTIALALRYTMLDTLNVPVTTADTLQFLFREPKTKKKIPKAEEDGKEVDSVKPLKVNTIKNKGRQHPFGDINFTLDYPVKNIDPTKFELYIIPDTIEIAESVFPYIDSSHLRRVKISKKWKEEATYRLILYPGAIFDVYESTNDTLDVKFNIKPVADYGTINISLENVEDTISIEILKGNKIVRKREIISPGMYVFEFMDPDTYRVKFVHDRNRNGKWDTGKYMEGIQPERVEFLPKDIKVRSNWDHDISYVIGSNDSPPSSGKKKSESNEKPPLF
jgi:hypothetical protein